jgi:hypothetical protein
MIRWMLTAAALAVAGTALAKLPAPDEAAKAKAAEAAARSAWQGKLDLYQLCKAQDRVATYYKSHNPKPAAAAAAPAATAAPTAASPTTASQGGSTPVAAVATPVAAAATSAATLGTCADPGPFAYAPPDQKPLETSGAHSPAATATSPPSVRAESGSMTSGKTGGTPKP